jgi:hypothetical protein
VEIKQVHSTGRSLEEMTLQALFDADWVYYEFVFHLFGLDIREGVAYVNVSVPPIRMGGTGTFGAVAYTETIFENLRQFPHITHVQLLFEGSIIGLHSMVTTLTALR